MSEKTRRNLVSNVELSESQKKDIKSQAARIEQSFRLKGVEIDNALKKAIESASVVVETEAAAMAPVDTGLLRKSISHRVIIRDGYPVGQVGTSVEYAPHQEFGTAKMKAQPFLAPALKRKRFTIIKIIESGIKGAL